MTKTSKTSGKPAAAKREASKGDSVKPEKAKAPATVKGSGKGTVKGKAANEVLQKPVAAAAVSKMSAAEKTVYRDMLVALRERLSGQIAALKGDSLERHDSTNIEEDGTDAFERQFALSLVSSEQDALFEVDEALRRLNEGVYGSCSQCNGRIEPNRLKALPFVRTCIKCQSEMEGARGRTRPRILAVD